MFINTEDFYNLPTYQKQVRLYLKIYISFEYCKIFIYILTFLYKKLSVTSYFTDKS